MATDEQRARRRAQRATAARVREKKAGGKYTPVVPRSTRAAVRAGREAYANAVIAGQIDYPEKRSREANNLASLASKASWGKADPRYEAAFSRYWYHKSDEDNDADVEDNADYDGESDNADNEERDGE